MATQRQGQRWVLDALVATGGFDVLHPEVRGIFEEIGYYHSDIDRVFSKVGSTLHFPRAWGETAQEIERKAIWAERKGFSLAARDYYARAMLLYGRAQYSYFQNDVRKRRFQRKVTACHAKVAKHTKEARIRRVEIPFEKGKKIFGIFYTPPGKGPFPCVVLGPGMDMFKEDWHAVILRHYIPRGFAALAMDGPGQGETLTFGCKVDATNYERAGSKFIDWLVKRREVSARRIVHFGVSMGSYWGARMCAHDRRIRASATAMGNTGYDLNIIFNVAQPNFKANYMNMAGYTDEKKFDEEMFPQLNLRETLPKIKCPCLWMHGEFDELTPLDHVLKNWENIPKPREIWVFGNEYHPLGGVGQDFLSLGADWLVAALAGKIGRNHNRQVYFEKDGRIIEGDARPPWWDSRRVLRG